MRIQPRVYVGKCFGNVSDLVPMATFSIVHHWATGDARGAPWSNGMSGREVQADVNVLSAFALMIGGALGIGLPLTLIIIWVCS